ncbi:MAG: hypothetical protein KC910_11355 [Candidatus Eremiobacteraeota bacterium]|nr:hypothetical protein [Candidatus Eremiobacteraeota bacterium]
MNIEALRKLSQDSRAGLKGEQSKLVCQVIDEREQRANQAIATRVKKAIQELDSRLEQAAARGQDEAVLLRVAYALYDLRDAVRDKLGRIGPELKSNYPHLARNGPLGFREIDDLLKELDIRDGMKRDAVPWLEGFLKDWKKHRQRKGLSRLISKKKLAVPEALEPLLEACRERELEPEVREYKSFEDSGLEVVVTW